MVGKDGWEQIGGTVSALIPEEDRNTKLIQILLEKNMKLSTYLELKAFIH